MLKSRVSPEASLHGRTVSLKSRAIDDDLVATGRHIREGELAFGIGRGRFHDRLIRQQQRDVNATDGGAVGIFHGAFDRALRVLAR